MPSRFEVGDRGRDVSLHFPISFPRRLFEHGLQVDPERPQRILEGRKDRTNFRLAGEREYNASNLCVLRGS